MLSFCGAFLSGLMTDEDDRLCSEWRSMSVVVAVAFKCSEKCSQVEETALKERKATT